MITAMIISENFVLRAGFRTWLDNDADITVVGEVGIGTRALNEVERWDPDVVVVDHTPPHIDTVRFLQQISDAGVESRIVVVSDVTEYHSVHRILEAGAAGYLGKSLPPSMLITAIKSVAKGDRFVDPLLVATFISPDKKQLSAREVEVLQLVGNGFNNRMIAKELDLGESTVKAHIRSSMQKLQVESRSAAVASALRSSLIH